jgi:hypothetical protein
MKPRDSVQVVIKVSLAYLAACKTVVTALQNAVEKATSIIDASARWLTDKLRILVVTPLVVTHQAASLVERVLKDTLDKISRPRGRSSTLHGAIVHGGI